MAYRITWSPRAIEDLEAIAQFIATDSPFYAGAVVKNILRSCRNLSKFPLAGRVVPEIADDNIRETFVYSYRVSYRLQEDVITIAASVHGRRLLNLHRI